jgi:hypothetical protein
MAYPFVNLVEALGINAIVLAHTFGEVAVRCFNEQVVVVPHLTEGVNDPIKTFADLFQDLQLQFPVSIFEVDIVPSVSP